MLLRKILSAGIAVGVLAAVAGAPIATPARAAEANEPGRAERYVHLYEQVLAANLRGPKRDLLATLTLCDVAGRLLQRTGQARYRDTATELLDAALGQMGSRPLDFKELRAFGLACLTLKRQGLLSAAEEAALRPLAEREIKAFLASKDDGDYNIRIAQVLGAACLYRLFEQASGWDLHPVRAKLDHYWALVRETGDLDEDSSNYTCLGLTFLVELVRVMGWENDLRASEGFRRLFERQRDTVSPAGLLPEFGDAYFSYTRGFYDWLFVSEYAAQLYDDPTFRYAAEKLYAPGMATAGLDGWYRGESLITLPLCPRPVQDPPALSQVTYRRNRQSPAPQVDKLILRTGNRPGDAMLFLDLYAGGSHAHPEKGPSVAYYEADGVPLFHNMGRHGTRSAITGNLLWTVPRGQAFPGLWRPDQWFTMSIPLEYLNRVGEDQYALGESILFRNFQERNRKVGFLSFDNLRLEGPAGVRLIDGFERSDSWHASVKRIPGVDLTTSDEHTEGRFSQRLNWKVVPSGHQPRLFEGARNVCFRGSDYDALKLDVKYTGERPYMHIRGVGEQIDLGDQALPTTIESARAEQRGRDAYGEVSYSRYGVAGCRLRRRLVLTAGGVLVIQDELMPAARMAGGTAGQLWQLYTLQAQGKDWFCADDDGAYAVPQSEDRETPARPVARQMLVKYATDAGTEAFAEKVSQGYYCPNPKNRPASSFYTTGSRRLLDGQGRQIFTMVVVPLDPKESPRAVAEGVSFARDAAGAVVVVIPRPGTASATHVRLDARGWMVTRE